MGVVTDYNATSVSRSMDSYAFIAHARPTEGTLVGEILVRPHFQGQGVGSMLLEAVKAQYCGVPVCAKPFQDQAELETAGSQVWASDLFDQSVQGPRVS